MRRNLTIASLVLIASCEILRADTIAPGYTEVDGTQGGVPTAVNLLTQGQPTFSSLAQSNFTPWNGGSSGISALNDNDLSAFSLSLPNSSWTLKATLDTTLNSGGYDITDIKTISGWNADYVDQNYQLLYSTVGAPSRFLSLGTFSLNNTNPVSNGLANSPTTLQIDLPGTHGGVIASHVGALEFEFSAANSTYGNSTAYREIEAFGVASVPEPASLALLILGMAGTLARRHRKA